MAKSIGAYPEGVRGKEVIDEVEAKEIDEVKAKRRKRQEDAKETYLGIG